MLGWLRWWWSWPARRRADAAEAQAIQRHQERRALDYMRRTGQI